MPEFNIWAVLAAAASGFVLGGLWYSPALFGKAWQREIGLSEAQPEHNSSDAAVRAADHQLYRAKQNGRNRVESSFMR